MSANLDEKLSPIYEEILRRNPGEVEFHQAVREVLEMPRPRRGQDILISATPRSSSGSVSRSGSSSSGCPGWTTRVRCTSTGVSGWSSTAPRALTRAGCGSTRRVAGHRQVPRVRAGLQELADRNAHRRRQGRRGLRPQGPSDAEIMRFCQSFMTELYRHLGEHTDVPAGDIGVGQREIGYMFGQYKRITNRYESGVLTGKGIGVGRFPGATEATGYGGVYFVRRCSDPRRVLEGKRVSSRVRATWPSTRSRRRSSSARMWCLLGLQRLRGRRGGDRPRPAQANQGDRARTRVRLRQAARRPRPLHRRSSSIWEVPCDIALPSATQNELTGRDAITLVRNGVSAVAEGANMPCTPEASGCSWRRACVRAGKAANAGGVATSALEMQQNASRDSWTFEYTEKRLAEIMRHIHDTCYETAERYGRPGDYVAGANIAAFESSLRRCSSGLIDASRVAAGCGTRGAHMVRTPRCACTVFFADRATAAVPCDDAGGDGYAGRSRGS